MWFLLSAFTISTPFRASETMNTMAPDHRVVVGITHVTLGEDREKNDLFWTLTETVVDSLAIQKGYLGHKRRKQLFGNQAWTMTVWLDDASLNGFIRAETHSKAIREGMDAMLKSRFVRVTLPRSKVPLSWNEAEKIMEEKGREMYGKGTAYE
ncbi:MAG: hypothetical protein ACK5O7_01070 [Holosporales bacterium]